MVCVSGMFDTSSQSVQVLDWIRSATPESFRKGQAMLVKHYDDVTPDGAAHFPVVFEKTMKMWFNEPHIRREELAKISAPTLVMVADRDAVTPEHTLELFRSIKGAKLGVIPGTTHFLLSEKPAATSRMILWFLLEDAN